MFEGLRAVTTCMFNLLNYDIFGTNVSEGRGTPPLVSG